MTFETILKKIVEPSGGIGAALMGSDGIPIAQVLGVLAGEDTEEEVSVLSVEFGRILAECQKAADSSGTGGLEEISVQLEDNTILLRRIDDETYLAVVLGPDGNAGRARFDIRRHLLDLRDQL